MAEYIKKSAVHEILYDCLLHGKSKYTGFYRAWDEIKNWEGVNEPFVRCRDCANGVSIAHQDKKFYCQVFNCEVPDKGFCYRGAKKKVHEVKFYPSGYGGVKDDELCWMGIDESPKKYTERQKI